MIPSFTLPPLCSHMCVACSHTCMLHGQIDSIRCEDSDWDFDDCGASAFTYLSVLGTGWFIPLACCLIQLFMLMVLTLDALFPPADEDGEPPDADVR